MRKKTIIAIIIFFAVYISGFLILFDPFGAFKVAGDLHTIYPLPRGINRESDKIIFTTSFLKSDKYRIEFSSGLVVSTESCWWHTIYAPICWSWRQFVEKSSTEAS